MLMIFGETLGLIYSCSHDCVVYGKIMDSQNRLGEWVEENEMKINPGKVKQ